MNCRQCREKRIKAAGFDFDGTLFLTEDDKARIAENSLAFIHPAKGAAKDYAGMAGMKLSRKQKLEVLFRKYCGKPNRKIMRSLMNVFDIQYKNRLAVCPLVQCVDVLKTIKKQVGIVFLVSLTEKKIVVEALKHCGLYKYFTQVYCGGDKTVHFKGIMKQKNLLPEEVLYIGDAESDILASRNAGIHFVGITKKSGRSKLLRQLGAHKVIRSLCEFPGSIREWH